MNVMADLVVPLIGILFSGVVVGSVLSFILERRQKKAQGVVAARTVDLEVDAVALSNESAAYRNLAQRIDLIEQAHNTERESLTRTISILREDLDNTRRRLTAVEEDMGHVTKRHQIALAYIKILLAFIKDSGPDHRPLPPVPPELELDFN